MPEGVEGAVEKERSASFYGAERSVKQQDSTCLQAGRRGAGWKQPCLPPHTRSSLAEAGGWL